MYRYFFANCKHSSLNPQSTGNIQREALYINKSLSFLEQVIRALADKRRDHIPYRQSKLTHVLKDSLGGNCSTLLIANIWAERGQILETVWQCNLIPWLLDHFNVCEKRGDSLGMHALKRLGAWGRG